MRFWFASLFAAAAGVCLLLGQSGQQATLISLGAAPTPPTGSMTAWWSADCITFSSGICSTPSNGTVITTWDDQSGNGNTITRWIGSNDVTFNTSQINGKPAVTFSNTGLSLSPGIAASAGYSAFAVIRKTDSARVMTIGSVGSSGGFKWWFSSSFQGCDSTSVLQLGTGTASWDTSWHQANVTYVNNSTTLAFRKDKAADATQSAAASNITTSIDAFAYSGGDILHAQLAEFILYNGVLSGGQIATIESYFAGKYGL